MYTEEELFELMGAAKRFEEEYGVPIDSAMQSDVPGYTWGLASALAHHGVNYLSVGPNPGHRHGAPFAWGDKPFWWVDPSGQHKVLFWMAGKGYWSFHGRPIGHRLAPQTIFDYLDALEKKGYPYDMVLIRYDIGGDNGPPNPVLPDVVKEWNEKYAYPRLIIARNSDVLKEFATRYGDQIPVVTGDFTPYWEDGSASTSLATSVNRRACEKIAQAQILWAMLNPGLELHDRFDAAWTKLIMYDEHTWGAHNSISQPDHPFAIRQDEYKQAFAFDGSRMTDALLADVTQHLGKTGSNVIDVYNTASWSRDGLVLVGTDESAAGDLVKDDQDRPVPSQRLASGELAFVARDVPAFGARRYTLHAGDAHRAGSAEAIDLRLTNGLVSLEIDPQTGAINTLRHQAIDNDLVDTQEAPGLNDYLYIIGRDAGKNRLDRSGAGKGDGRRRRAARGDAEDRNRCTRLPEAHSPRPSGGRFRPRGTDQHDRQAQGAPAGRRLFRLPVLHSQRRVTNRCSVGGRAGRKRPVEGRQPQLLLRPAVGRPVERRLWRDLGDGRRADAPVRSDQDHRSHGRARVADIDRSRRFHPLLGDEQPLGNELQGRPGGADDVPLRAAAACRRVRWGCRPTLRA